MGIKKTIKRVLKEDKIKSLFRIITKLIEYFLSKDEVEKYICDYKLESGEKRFKVTLYFKPTPKKTNLSIKDLYNKYQ